MEDCENDSFEEDPFVDESFVDDSPVDDSPYKYSTNEWEALRKAKDDYSNIIEKYICLSHGLPSPGFTARHASRIQILNQPVERKGSVNESPKIGSHERITSKVSLEYESDVECEDPIQEEIENTLLKRKRELGLSEDYVLEEFEWNDEIEVSNIGLEEEYNEDDDIPMKKSARLEAKSRFEKKKNTRNEGNREKSIKFKVKRTPGRPRKFPIQGELERRETNRSLKESTVLGKRKNETKSPGRPKKILPKKTPGRPKMFPRKSPGRPKKLTKKRGPGRPKKFPKKNSPDGARKASISKIGKQEGETEAKETQESARKSSISQIGKQEAETKAKETRGRPKNSPVSKIGKQGGETKSKKTRGRPRNSTSSEIYKDKRKELSDKTRDSIGKPGPSSVSEISEPEKIKLGKVGRPRRLSNKSKIKSFDSNRNPVLHKSISRYFKYISTNFDISKEQGHLAVSQSLDLTFVPPLKEGCYPDIKSFCPSNDLLFVIPFVSETSVLEKDKGLGVQTNARYVKKISKRDGAWKKTSTSAIDFMSNDCLPKGTQNKTKTKDKSKLENHCFRLSSKIHSGQIEKLICCEQVLENSHSESEIDDLRSEVDYESQLQDKEPQDHENTGSYKHCSNKVKGSDTRLIESENVIDLNQNSESNKDGNQIECEMKKVQLEKIGGEPIKRQLRRAQKNRQTLPVENLIIDENHNKNGFNLPSTQAISQLTVAAKKSKGKEQYPSLENDSEGKCKAEEHSSTSVRQGMRLRKFSKETQLKSRNSKKVETSAPNLSPSCIGSIKNKKSVSQKGQGKKLRKISKETQIKSRKRNEVEASVPLPSPSSNGSIKSINSVSQQRVKESLGELSTSQDDSGIINRSLPDIFTLSDGEDDCKKSCSADEKNCEKLCSSDEKNYENSSSAEEKTCKKSLDPMLKDLPPTSDRDRPKSAKGNVASDYIDTTKDTEINNDFDGCSRNYSPKRKKSLDNEEDSPEINTEVKSNPTFAPPYSENDGIEESLKELTTSVCETSSNAKKKIDDFQVIKATHEDSVVAGIDIVKKKRISLAPRSKETLNSDQYISSIMPTEETQPSNVNSRTAELDNGVLSSAPVGVDMPEVSMERPQNKGMSQLDTIEREKVGNDNEDSDDEVKLKLMPVVKYPEAVGSWHPSMSIIRKWSKLLRAERNQHLKKPEPPRPENNLSKSVDTTEISTTGCSKARSFFDLSDDDLSLPSDGEEDSGEENHAESVSSKPQRMNLSKKFGVSFLRKSSKKVPQNSSRYKEKFVA